MAEGQHTPCCNNPLGFTEDNRPHVVCMPCPLQGHIISLLRLASALAYHGVAITFVCFNHNLPVHHFHNLHPSINLHFLSHLASTDDHPKDPFYLLRPFPVAQPALENLLIDSPNTSCIISDTFLHWVQDVANRFQIPKVDYWPCTATQYLLLLHLPELVSKGFLPLQGPITNWNGDDQPLIDFIPRFPALPITDLCNIFLVQDLSNPIFQLFAPAFTRAREAHTVLIHSLYELESNAFDALRAEQIPVHSVGPLLHFSPSLKSADSTTPDLGGSETRPDGEDQECLRWLDSQAVSSVLYVSFGTVASLSPDHVVELAYGLEQSEHAFLWVFRPDSRTGNFPEGFTDRTKGRGLVIPWAPQVEVLSHPSVGGFLTHCGWNSTLESIWMGVAMIGCPMIAEQRCNMRSIADVWRVGLRLEKKPDGKFTREAVQRAVKALMQGEEGKDAKRRVKEMSQIAKKTANYGGLSHGNLLKFIEAMKVTIQPHPTKIDV